jgi:hypothetical protein
VVGPGTGQKRQKRQKRPAAHGSIACGVEAELNDATDEMWVLEAGGQGGLGEIFIAREGRVGIGLDEDDFSLGVRRRSRRA